MSRRTTRGLVLGVAMIVIANLLGGLSYPAQKIALRGLPPATLLLVRNFIGLIPIGLWVAYRGIRFGAYTRADLFRLFLLGTFAFGAPMLLGIIGTSWATASNGSILVLIEPPVILLIARIFLGESISRLKLLGVLIGLIGALSLVLEGASMADLFGGEHLRGNAVLLLHGILWGFYTPFVKPLADRHDPIGIAFLTLAFSIPPFLPLAVTEWSTWELGPATYTALGWAAGLGVFVSCAGTLLWVAALRHISAGTAAPFVFLQPIAGVLVGLAFLDERLTPAGVVGGLLISVGVVFAIRPR